MPDDLTGSFVNCFAGHIEYMPSLTDEPKGKLCRGTDKVPGCNEPIIQWKPIGKIWEKIPGPWWGEDQE